MFSAVRFLNNLESEVLDECCEIFFQNFFPKEKNHRLVDLYQEVLQRRRHEREKSKEHALQIHKSLKIILEILDKGNKGFLVGDIHPKLIKGCEKVLQRTISVLQENLSEMNYEKIISDMYDEMGKFAFICTFKLPLYGILYPEHESRRNLYERQLILEEESNLIAVDKFVKVYEDLQNFEMSHNLKFSKKYIVEWFPNLTKAIKEE